MNLKGSKCKTSRTCLSLVSHTTTSLGRKGSLDPESCAGARLLRMVFVKYAVDMREDVPWTEPSAGGTREESLQRGSLSGACLSFLQALACKLQVKSLPIAGTALLSIEASLARCTGALAQRRDLPPPSC